MTITRRQLLTQAGLGLGALALGDLVGRESAAAAPAARAPGSLAPRPPHFPGQAKSVIFLYMDGGVSQVDSFDPKPLLAKEHGKKPKFKIDATVFNNIGTLLKSPWQFARHGECGMPVSELFPHIGSCADDLCVIRSMQGPVPDHPNANYALHTGYAMHGKPSMGAWISYGLGTENQDLPGFVVIHGGRVPSGGVACFSNGFLPANYQGSIFLPTKPRVRNIASQEASEEVRQRKLEYLRQFDRELADSLAAGEAIEAAIRNYELAFRMQSAVPEAMDLSQETQAMKRFYGMEESYKFTQLYATQCLLARRLVERGVRFVQLTIPQKPGVDRWDQHSNLVDGHTRNARMVDQPIGALIKDLKQRGLLESTLIVFSGEFGRTPFAQGANGRDHNPQGFSLWMAGGGVRGGTVYGATDEYGYRAIENKMTLHDLHANLLHLMGIDHERLTFRHSGRDFRLTDVEGRIVPEILA
ncbi:MAG: DUF1501 domain-containing protein [Planctomycetota bacterium]|nr:MAG: DUF1501 domain-containing protein [Planctomycetota bacterium]REJ97109.1 MAG: DUF1501 domain-containing protein [Planctomycetota bacterium]REK22493.1 MAG: DUF1501 domain-containing protein [Planctomycetota bacterium]REK47135.1 MAG: DUF1501 domain-containing protein [Planctomycetota bacterium]